MSWEESTDCTDKCRSRQHGGAVCRIGVEGVDERSVVSGWEGTCRNYWSVKDEFGRSALHIAVSCGNRKVVEWLIRKDRGGLNWKDLISGYTPLHRSIYFGHIHIARTLIRSGASLSAVDNDGLTPLELCLDERRNYLPWTKDFNLNSDPTELFLWGTNDNLTLGTESQTSRKTPEALERFRPGKAPNSSVSSVVLQTFHSLFLLQNGQVFTCGMGTNGRLGLGVKDKVILIPHRVPLKEVCVAVAAGPDHSLFLLGNGQVMSCGSNANFVLGHGDEEDDVFHPRLIQSLRTIKIGGLRASGTHSVFFRANRLYTCGLNKGQLGHNLTPQANVILPRLVNSVGFSADGKPVSPDSYFTDVEVNDCATVVRLGKGLILLLHRHDIRRIHAQQFSVDKVCVVGGDGGPLTLFLLTKSGGVVIWREDEGGGGGGGSFSQVVWDMGRPLVLKDIVITPRTILTVSEGGEAFIAGWNVSTPPILSPNRNSVEEGKKRLIHLDHSTWIQSKPTINKGGKGEVGGWPLEHLRLKRVPNIHGGEGVSCDPKANNFAVIQRYHKLEFTTLPLPLPSRMREDLEGLYEEAQLEDNIHDIVIHVENSSGGRCFPAHRVILFHVSPLMKDMVQEEGGEIKLCNTHPTAFEHVLRFIYTGTCSLLLGKSVDEWSGVWKDTMRLARELRVDGLIKGMKRVEAGGSGVEESPIFPRRTLDYLSDLLLISSDKALIPAHLPILIARMTYFHGMMFSGSWAESKTRKVKMCLKKRTLELMLDFVYEDKRDELSELEAESLLELLMGCDLYGLGELRAEVELTLAESLHLKNVSELLSAGIAYNATQLQESCLNFIAINLTPLLENRLLDGIGEDEMERVGKYYRNLHPLIPSRRLTSSISLPLSSPPPSLHFEEFLLLEEEDQPDFHISIKTTKTKGRKTRGRLRTLSCESSQTSSSLTTLIPPPTHSIPIPIQTSHREEVKRGSERRSIPLTISNLDFPLLSTPPQSTHSISSPPPQGLNGRKKTKWRSLEERVIVEKERGRVLSGGRDPCNPWQRKEEDGGGGGGGSGQPEFKEIVKEEEEMKINLHKAITKPLPLMQIEELAMEELKKRYRSEETQDGSEMLNITRMSSTLNYPSPTWIPTHPPHPPSSSPSSAHHPIYL